MPHFWDVVKLINNMGLVRYLKNWLRHDHNVRQQLQVVRRQVDVMENMINELTIVQKENQRKSYLQECVMTCSDMGVTNQRLCDEDIIVSLTSYGNRINEVYLAIESIMQGTVKPNRIILWLPEEMKGISLPSVLQRQRNRGLQIEYCQDVRSYTKLIPTLKKYSDASIITIDDDVMYELDLVENLVRTHIERPNKICANRIHKIKLDDKGYPMSYLEWDMCSSNGSDSKLNFLTGVGGVLYPPNAFLSEVFNEEVFMNICKYADDVWFYAMLLMNDKDIVKSFTHAENGCDYVEISNPQEHALCSINTDAEHCMNDVQIKAVFDKYNLWHLLKE